MQYLRIDQYTHVSRDCPVGVDTHPADDVVEVTLGNCRIGDGALRIVIDHPDTCLRLVTALQDARDRLISHLRLKAGPGTAMLWNMDSHADPRAFLDNHA